MSPKGIFWYAYVPHFVLNVVLSWSSGWTKTWLYPENPSRKDINSEPATDWRICSIVGNGKLSFKLALLRFLKSIQIWMSPFFFLTGTILETQFECRTGKIILAFKSLLSSDFIWVSKFGCIFLNLCWIGFWSGSIGMVCWIIDVSYVFKSSYLQAKTCLFFLNSLINASFSSWESPTPKLMFWGASQCLNLLIQT